MTDHNTVDVTQLWFLKDTRTISKQSVESYFIDDLNAWEVFRDRKHPDHYDYVREFILECENAADESNEDHPIELEDVYVER